MDFPFDPNGPGLHNGKLYGLPFEQKEAKLIVIPVAWDATVSYRAGTAEGPLAILEASTQVELYHETEPNAWQAGIFLNQASPKIEALNQPTRSKAKQIIDAIEAGQSSEDKRRPGPHAGF